MNDTTNNDILFERILDILRRFEGKEDQRVTPAVVKVDIDYDGKTLTHCIIWKGESDYVLIEADALQQWIDRYYPLISRMGDLVQLGEHSCKIITYNIRNNSFILRRTRDE